MLGLLSIRLFQQNRKVSESNSVHKKIFGCFSGTERGKQLAGGRLWFRWKAASAARQKFLDDVLRFAPTRPGGGGGGNAPTCMRDFRFESVRY